MLRIDLHTHSAASPDGSLTAIDYRHMLDSGRLNVVAVTDHNRIDFAEQLYEKLGDAIIVGEEISAQEGEVIGLYLRQAIPAGLTAQGTIQRIHKQGGLAYIPHPFESVRKGLPQIVLDQIAAQVDIIETYNGRTLQDRAKRATDWASTHAVAGASSSDAHGWHGWGNTGTVVAKQPTRETLVELLRDANHHTKSTGVVGRLYPKLNRLRKRGLHA